MANEDEGFNCCGESPTGAQAAECIVQDLDERVIPCGTRKMAGQARQYKTTTGAWFVRIGFQNWSRKQGREIDPIIWFTEMGHGPVPDDAKD